MWSRVHLSLVLLSTLYHGDSLEENFIVSFKTCPLLVSIANLSQIFHTPQNLVTTLSLSCCAITLYCSTMHIGLDCWPPTGTSWTACLLIAGVPPTSPPGATVSSSAARGTQPTTSWAFWRSQLKVTHTVIPVGSFRMRMYGEHSVL